MEIQREEELLKFIRNLETKEVLTSTELKNLREWRAERLALINCRAKEAGKFNQYIDIDVVSNLSDSQVAKILKVLFSFLYFSFLKFSSSILSIVADRLN